MSLTKPRRLKFIVTHSNESRVQTGRKFTANPMRRQSIGQAAHPSAQSCRPEAQTSNCGSRLVPSRSVLPSACIVSPIASATTLQLMTFWPWIVRDRQAASICVFMHPARVVVSTCSVSERKPAPALSIFSRMSSMSFNDRTACRVSGQRRRHGRHSGGRASSLFGSWLAQGGFEPRSGSGHYLTSIDGNVRLVALLTPNSTRRRQSASSWQPPACSSCCRGFPATKVYHFPAEKQMVGQIREENN